MTQANRTRTNRISNMTLLALAIASTKRAQPAFVRAFTHSGFRTPSASMGLASNILFQNEQDRKQQNPSFPFSQFRESSSKVTATVEDDLDSALDEILGSAFEEAGDTSASKTASVSAAATAPADTEDNDEDIPAENGTVHLWEAVRDAHNLVCGPTSVYVTQDPEFDRRS